MNTSTVPEPARLAEPLIDIDEHWQRLVTVALLGTDRRDPPRTPEPVADVVADNLSPTPAERMLVDVATTVAVRRSAFLPLPPNAMLSGPSHDERPICSPAAVARWHHIIVSWPVLEDEWLITLIEHAWRIDPQLVPALLMRHRADAERRARVVAAAGPIAPWLVAHRPGLGPTGSGSVRVDAELLMTLPALPIPPELTEVAQRTGDEVGAAFADALESGTLGVAHRPVLVNLIARVRPDALELIATEFTSIDPTSPNHGLAASLADLAITRHAMLAELRPPQR